MSTHGIILVTGKTHYGHDKTIRIYKHCDSYPSGNLLLIAEALAKAKQQCDEHNESFKSSKPLLPTVDQVVGLIIGAATGVFGMGARIDTEGDQDEKAAIYNEKFKQKHLGNQWDLEWLYIVNLDDNSVKVYGGGYSGESPQHLYKKGTVDPLSYAEQLKKEYQQQERIEIQNEVTSIETAGFKMNPKRKRTPKKNVVQTQGHIGEVATVIPIKAAA